MRVLLALEPRSRTESRYLGQDRTLEIGVDLFAKPVDVVRREPAVHPARVVLADVVRERVAEPALEVEPARPGVFVEPPGSVEITVHAGALVRGCVGPQCVEVRDAPGVAEDVLPCVWNRQRPARDLLLRRRSPVLEPRLGRELAARRRLPQRHRQLPLDITPASVVLVLPFALAQDVLGKDLPVLLDDSVVVP